MAALTLGLGIVVAGGTWFPHRETPPTPASVLFVLGPPEMARIRAAQDLMARGAARELVLSIPTYASARSYLCEARTYPVTCYTPDPSNTRGEAQVLRRMMSERGWTSAIVLTVDEHVSRTRFIVGRCTNPGQQVTVVGAPAVAPPWWRLYQVLYQGAGYARELLRGSC